MKTALSQESVLLRQNIRFTLHAYSSNGTSWTAVADSPFGSTSVYVIAYGGGKFVAVGVDGKMVYSKYSK
jgi:hypothetical protein